VQRNPVAGARPATIFIADDEEVNHTIVRRALATFPYTILSFADGQALLEAVEVAFREGRDRPDLIISDVMMPRLNGYHLAEAIKGSLTFGHVPVLIVTGLDRLKDKVRALECGADDFIQKPLHALELAARVRSLLRIKAMHDELEEKNRLLLDEKGLLESLVHARTLELENLNIGLVAALEKANELNDNDTGSHILRVCAFSEVLAKAIGQPAMWCQRVRRNASLHDVGKVGIPDAILKKAGKLTPEEYEVMKTHTTLGYDLLVAAKADKLARNIALCHHERWDGTGYPNGLKGETIPLEARILAIADVYDALTQKRVYKDAWSEADCIDEIRNQSGHHFDPALVQTLGRCRDEFNAIRERYRDLAVA